MPKPLIVITGKNGQLGWELHRLYAGLENKFDFLFTGRDELDLGKPQTIPSFFKKYQPEYFINCGAYTAVDKAETEQEAAYTINAESVGILAKECAAVNGVFITLSTDYVFNGKGTKPYTIDEPTQPINYYGYTKWLGEKLALENCKQTIIIRASWVYSLHGNNFVKTMLRLMKERPEISVVDDQVGSPTYARDLAAAILHIVYQLSTINHQPQFGIYHFSNKGAVSWYNFAVAIKTLAGLNCKVNPIPSSSYPTPAKRPSYSVMDTGKITEDYKVVLNDWEESLKDCLHQLVNMNS